MVEIQRYQFNKYPHLQADYPCHSSDRMQNGHEADSQPNNTFWEAHICGLLPKNLVKFGERGICCRQEGK